MSKFLRYLISFVFHLIWARSGGSGAVPPVRLPKGKQVPMPVIGPWQMMIAMWLFKKMWHSHGQRVKEKLADAPSPLVNRVASWIPDTPQAAKTKAANPGSANNAQVPAPAPSNPQPAQHDTQPLKSSANGGVTQGSVLNSLRRPDASPATS